MVGTAYYIVKDANDYGKNFPNSKNLYVLENDKSTDNKILSAFELSNKTYTETSDLAYVSKSFYKYEFTNINDEYYKIILIKTGILDYVNNVELEEMGIELTGQQMKNILESPTPKEVLIYISGKDLDAKNLKISDDELRNYLFSYVITEVYNPKNINILLSNIKSDNIVMYENTALFKSIKYVPNMFIKDITQSGNKSIFS